MNPVITDQIIIKPIRTDEWLPDRCLTSAGPFDPKKYPPETGCPGINYRYKNNRETLVQLYKNTIEEYGMCGFIAWEKDKIVAYHTFFPYEIAQNTGFYGFGSVYSKPGKTLVHNCLSIVKGDYLRRGISGRLVLESVNQAKINNWERFEVHNVLPDCEKGWQSDQKSCLTFWQKYGFRIFKEYKADRKTREYYKVNTRYSLYLEL